MYQSQKFQLCLKDVQKDIFDKKTLKVMIYVLKNNDG